MSPLPGLDAAHLTAIPPAITAIAILWGLGCWATHTIRSRRRKP